MLFLCSYILALEQTLPGCGTGGHYPVMCVLPGLPPEAPEPRGGALVHWCHGSPGAVYLFAQAYEVRSQNIPVHDKIYIYRHHAS